MKRGSHLFIFLLIIMSSCNSPGNDIADLSDEYCNCLKPLTQRMSEDTRNVVLITGNSDNPLLTIQQEFTALGSERAGRVREQMRNLKVSKDLNPDVNACLEHVSTKYKDSYALNAESTLRKIALELEKKSDCSLVSAVLKMGLKGSYK